MISFDWSVLHLRKALTQTTEKMKTVHETDNNMAAPYSS